MWPAAYWHLWSDYIIHSFIGFICGCWSTYELNRSEIESK